MAGPAPEAPASPVVYSRELFDAVYEADSDYIWSKLRRRIAKKDLSPESAEDIHQDAFVQVDEKLHMEKVEKPRAMLVSIVEHALANRSRSRARRGRVMVPNDGTVVDDAVAEQGDGEDRVSQTDDAEMVEAIFEQMPPDQVLAMRLIDLDGMSRAEAATEMKRKEDTVRQLHCRARKTFREVGLLLFGEVLEDLRE